jgi:hypothetical protein
MFPEAFTILLPLHAIATLGLALMYLRRRRMTSRAHALWGIFALLVPVLGPFLVIAAQPGGRRPRPRGDAQGPVQRSQSLRRFSPR